jgi:hypothetical protein
MSRIVCGIALGAWCLAACGDGGGSNGGNPADGGDTDADTDADSDTDTDADTDTDTDTDTTPTGVTNGVVDAFGTSQVYTQISAAGDGLARPRDLAFDPNDPTHLWTVNQDSDATVIYFDPGEPTQTVDKIKDPDANHFMEEVSSIAFGQETGNEAVFGTCQESRNTYNDTAPANDFMGPTLWPASLDVYGVIAGELGYHIDMLHESPQCMGIEWDIDNAFWVFDGMNGNLVRYDFQDPHCIGCDDHSDGIVQRHTDVTVRRTPNVPSPLYLDRAPGLLYIADTANGRVLKVDPTTAAPVGNLQGIAIEELVEYTEWRGATVTEIASGLSEPSGIALAQGVLFVSDHGTGEIVAFDVNGNELGRISVPDGPGIMGLEIGPDGKLWYVDGDHDVVVRVDPIQ